HFGRSSSPQNHALTQHFYRRLAAAGLIEEREVEQVWSCEDGRFLPDRYIVCICPHCRYEAARGGQCDGCGTLLDPPELLDPQSPGIATSRSEPAGTCFCANPCSWSGCVTGLTTATDGQPGCHRWRAAG